MHNCIKIWRWRYDNFTSCWCIAEIFFSIAKIVLALCNGFLLYSDLKIFAIFFLNEADFPMEKNKPFCSICNFKPYHFSVACCFNTYMHEGTTRNYIFHYICQTIMVLRYLNNLVACTKSNRKIVLVVSLLFLRRSIIFWYYVQLNTEIIRTNSLFSFYGCLLPIINQRRYNARICCLKFILNSTRIQLQFNHTPM